MENGQSMETCCVNSHNEWDPLKEVIVGRVDGAAVPPWHLSIKGAAPVTTWDFLIKHGGEPYPKEAVDAANQNLADFIHILEAEGVVVKRPDIVDSTIEYSSPDWTSRGYSSANPRDVLLVVGSEIIEATMSWRSRYFEVHAYRRLIYDYFKRGARWTAAPRPMLKDSLYDPDYQVPEKGAPVKYATNESEPIFDAADFVRCGRDLFVQRSTATNKAGIQWMRQHLGKNYTIHEIKSRCRQPLHIDTTFMPLAPGKALVNPEYFDKGGMPQVLKKWDILDAPEAVITRGVSKADLCSVWLNMNVLMLDEKRVVVEKHQEPMIKALRDWGFEPIPCPFQVFYFFGGSFHCATTDVYREGKLESYF